MERARPTASGDDRARRSAPPRRRPPTFEPRFTLILVYLAAFFVLYAMLLVLPELLDVLGNMPPGPAQEEAAREATRDALRGRLLWVFLLALVTSAVGAHYRVLPGLRSRR